MCLKTLNCYEIERTTKIRLGEAYECNIRRPQGFGGSAPNKLKTCAAGTGRAKRVPGAEGTGRKLVTSDNI